MQRFFVSIKTENDAFAGDQFEREIARMLRQIADRLEAGHRTCGSVQDANGNRVCEYGTE
ncbi:hypothetical protein ABIF65_005966 [Bradyrhizobium japonicum]|uniref:Uncharacterized protein n=1 Tax=Bradyrhizobium barranii subsp. barranii TaxID=2823807 RepID=A0A939S955_9BRAD|nr:MULTISPECIES: hypothetical protein [Bradyrhizobium]MBR1002693.1 hypothetical protein [Bradyrhizobium liaoningense]MBR1025623.1 hypothetical protein [Bradyrhizobium liaoningense]MBR1068292.1 hypothetical protein [Bradyrhizobium liaoningense]MCP1744305.1 hypothetical protein [Bradyrhizobium japonicum]MCP1782583.1 hypothetical protein [Bradyrhizobium japonicum]